MDGLMKLLHCKICDTALHRILPVPVELWYHVSSSKKAF